MFSGVFDSFSATLKFATAALSLTKTAEKSSGKSLIIDTDIFSDVDDAGALLLASTLPDVNLLAVNVNHPSSFSVLATTAILSHYGKQDVPVGIRRPMTNETFFDTYFYEMGEFASKVAYHWSNKSLKWDTIEDFWDPVSLYRKTLSEQKDGSVTIASIGFFENLSGLLNSTADIYSPLSGLELISAKVSELVIMGGEYPSGREYNFFGDNSSLAAHVVNTWKGNITFSGTELGEKVLTGAVLTVEGPTNDPVRAAYKWYVGYNTPRYSWDPLTVLYACHGLGDIFEYGSDYGYNHIYPNGSNSWVMDPEHASQRWLKLKTDNVTAAQRLDQLFLEGARSVLPISHSSPDEL